MTKLRFAFAAVILSLVLTEATAPASASTYDVTSCQSLAGVNDSALTWSYSGNLGFPTALNVVDRCSSTGLSAFGATDALGVGSTASGVFAQWTFQAPPQTQIVRLQMNRRLEADAQTGWVAAGSTDLGTIASELCNGAASGSTDCVIDGTLDTPIAGGATRITYALSCIIGPSTCSNGAFLHFADLRVRSATVTLQDDSAPTLFAPTGDLVNPAGYHRGNQAASFNASDNTGIKERSVYVDGIQVGRVPRTCDYTQPVPCTNPQRDAQIFVDLDRLSDGPHLVRVAAKDAADNEARMDPPVTIVVDHTGPAAPSLSVGARGDTDPAVALSWAPAAEAQVAPLTEARWSACPVGSAKGCVSGTGAVSGSASLSLPSAGAWTVSVRIVDAAGNLGQAASANVRLTAAVTGELGGSATPVTPGTTARRSPRLTLARAVLDRATRRLTVAGALRRAVTGHVRITIVRTAGSRTVRRSVTARIVKGRYSARVRVTRAEAAARKLVVEVRSPSAGSYRTATVRRTVTRR